MVIATLAMLATPALTDAATIRLLTGVDAGNNVLGTDQNDPFWTIQIGAGGVTAAKTAAPGHGIICCGMETAGTQALWISDQSIQQGSVETAWIPDGTVTFARRTFDLTGFDLTTVSMTGAWRVADFRQGVYINGTLLQANTADGGSGWFADQALSLSAGAGVGFLVAGLNTIELRGTTGNGQWDGFWLDLLVDGRQGDTPIPEPATLTLLGLGLVAGVRNRLRRS